MAKALLIRLSAASTPDVLRLPQPLVVELELKLEVVAVRDVYQQLSMTSPSALNVPSQRWWKREREDIRLVALDGPTVGGPSHSTPATPHRFALRAPLR